MLFAVSPGQLEDVLDRTGTSYGLSGIEWHGDCDIVPLARYVRGVLPFLVRTGTDAPAELILLRTVGLLLELCVRERGSHRYPHQFTGRRRLVSMAITAR